MNEKPAFPSAASNVDAELLADLRQRLDAVLASVLQDAREVALVNFPNHLIPGDSLIWLGTRATLRRLGVDVVYQCSPRTFSSAVLRKKLPDGPVLLNGGGNFGDLYPEGEQWLRERLLTELRGTRLVQLPQTIHFRDEANLERMRKLVADHGGFTLIIREHRSKALADRYFDADIRFAPDMALGLEPLPRLGKPEVDVLWAHWLPTDLEYADHGGPPAGVSVRTLEWNRPLEDEPAWRRNRRFALQANTAIHRLVDVQPASLNVLWRPLAATFDPLAHAWVDRGRHLLSAGKVLATCKLHGHVMALLSGIPHVLMDNSHGKVSGVHRAWTHQSKLAHWAENGDQARALALQLLHDPSSHLAPND